MSNYADEINRFDQLQKETNELISLLKSKNISTVDVNSGSFREALDGDVTNVENPKNWVHWVNKFKEMDDKFFDLVASNGVAAAAAATGGKQRRTM